MCEARVRVWADGHPLRWSRGPPLVLPVVKALKDLGVAQSGGREGKELQAKSPAHALLPRAAGKRSVSNTPTAKDCQSRRATTRWPGASSMAA